MTRIKKICFLIQKGVPIKYHYNQYTGERRLVVDEIEGFKYSNSSKDQVSAGEYIDLTYWELTQE